MCFTESASNAQPALAHAEPGTFDYVSGSVTTVPGNVFGWLHEVGVAGDLLKAVQAFRDAAAIVDRLAIASSR
jgi:hypothetical protein